MTEEEVKRNLEENERMTMQSVCDTLRKHEGCTRAYLASFVASLCNVDRERMFSACNDLDVAQARWLFWYAYRYMTNETYEKIGRLSEELYGKVYTKVCVASSVNKMYSLIEQQLYGVSVGLSSSGLSRKATERWLSLQLQSPLPYPRMLN